MTRYVVITPVRDEEVYIGATIESVCQQTIRPTEWIIVDDGSNDRTGEIIDRYAAQVPWIRAIHRANRGFRKAGSGVIEAFYDGYHEVRCNDWELIVKLDGDLTFPPTYFEDCLAHFRSEPRLGNWWWRHLSPTCRESEARTESEVSRQRCDQDL